MFELAVNFPIHNEEKLIIKVLNILLKITAEKYNISEGKLLGIKLKKIEEKWINNDFKVSEKEVAQVLEN